MAVRIYSLAKELNLDSNVLVELCSKAGVLGKGALAGLTDDEVARVKSFIAAGGSNAASAAPRAAVATMVAQAAEARPLSREEFHTAAPSGMSRGGVRQLVVATPSPMTRPASTTAAGRPPILRTSPPLSSRPPAKRPIEIRPAVIRLAPLPAVEQPLLTPTPGQPLSGRSEPDGNASMEPAAFRYRAGSDDYGDDARVAVVERDEPDSIGDLHAESSIPAASPIAPAVMDSSSLADAGAKPSGGKSRANRKRPAPLYELLKRPIQPPSMSFKTTLSLSLVFAIPLTACLKVFVFNSGSSFFDFVIAGVWGAAASYLVLVLYSNWRKSVFFRRWKEEILEVAQGCGVSNPELNELIAKQYPKLSKLWESS